MNDLNNVNTPLYLSTRESAQKLQVSLGTVQKMVEMGELIAWKTRGGHRRILVSSLEQLLYRRQSRIKNLSAQNCVLLGLFKREENKEAFAKLIQTWETTIELRANTDSLEGLMQAVELNPDIIYLDALISPVEQVHLIHYLSGNAITRHIPIMVDEGFIALHPNVIELAAENAGILKPKPKNGQKSYINDYAQNDNQTIFSYPATTEDPINAGKPKILERIIRQILANRYTP